jgi:serine/threonine protein kinase
MSSNNLSHHFEYGKALMDSRFWEEAIHEFEQAAVNGFRPMQAWELCGDCAVELGKRVEAVRYYQKVYSDERVTDAVRKQILTKITQCSETQKRIDMETIQLTRKGEPQQAKPQTPGRKLSTVQGDSLPSPSIDSLDRSSAHLLIGRQLSSWADEAGRSLVDSPRIYNVTNLLRIGVSSVIVELEVDGTGEKMAGQTLSASFNSSLGAKKLADWVQGHRMSTSSHLVDVFDLAQCDDRLFIVREYLPLSLGELITTGEIMPVPMAFFIAHQILEGIGDLHLHMCRDEQVRTRYHLDLRPSQILIQPDRLLIKICNGGLWSLVEDHNKSEPSIRQLPLPFLAYRAPEQFRPYLGRKRPPIFTDIYLFGTIFYEMLTGIQAFQASSFDEAELQHCEQYPTPPKVWRPEIPQEISELIMNCLQTDPMKRWRSATQISLALEKSFNAWVRPQRDAPFLKYLQRPGTAL